MDIQTFIDNYQETFSGKAELIDGAEFGNSYQVAKLL